MSKRLNDFVVVDKLALAKAHPNLVKAVPDLGKIRQALRLGFGVQGMSIVGKDDES